MLRRHARFATIAALGLSFALLGSPVPDSAIAAPTATKTVTIKGYNFVNRNQDYSPAVLTIKKGTRVAWTNVSDDPHTVTGKFVTTKNRGKFYDSGEIPAFTGRYSFTFKEKGQFWYHCTLHPSMAGIIVVK